MNWVPENLPGKLARIASVPTLTLYLLTLSLGFASVIFTDLNQQLTASSSVQHLEFFFISFHIPLTLDLFLPTTLALMTYVACFIIASVSNGGYRNGLLARKKGNETTLPNWLVTMPILSSTLLILALLVTGIQGVIGIPTGELPALHFPELFAQLTTSPISEEVNYRITSLGLLIAVRSLLSTPEIKPPQLNKTVLVTLSFLAPDVAKGHVGLKTVAKNGLSGIHPAEWVLLAISSVAFGFAHLSGTPGWEIGKVTTATIMGFVIGFAYLAYGGYAAILLHWFFNYFLQSLYLREIGSFGSEPFFQLFQDLGTLAYFWSLCLGFLGLTCVLVFARRRRSNTSSGAGL